MVAIAACYVYRQQVRNTCTDAVALAKSSFLAQEPNHFRTAVCQFDIEKNQDTRVCASALSETQGPFKSSS